MPDITLDVTASIVLMAIGCGNEQLEAVDGAKLNKLVDQAVLRSEEHTSGTPVT